MLNNNAPLNAKLRMLGIYPKSFLESLKQTVILNFGLLQARTVTLCWKSSNAPSLGWWIKESSSCIGLERLAFIAKGKQNYQKALGTFYDSHDRGT